MYDKLSAKEKEYIDYLMSDKDIFNSFVYTPWCDAIQEIDKRQGNTGIDSYLNNILPHGIPQIMEGKKSMVVCRSVATPNLEMHRFMMYVDASPTLQPLIFEYTQDKYVGVNDAKKALMRLCFEGGTHRDRTQIVSCAEILDLHVSNGQRLDSLMTYWGERVIDVHHRLFVKSFPARAHAICDLSTWIHALGASPRLYYPGALSLFLKHGIWFENFFFSMKEYEFTKKILLPSFIQTIDAIGYKPLIVALDPFASEESHAWLSYPSELKKDIDSDLHKLT